MARKKSIESNQLSFVVPTKPLHPALRHRRSLILPKILKERAPQLVSDDPEFRRAHEIIIRWANLERDGHLDAKETALRGQFIAEVLGHALGFQSRTDKPDSYQLESEFTIPGNGTPDAALGNFASGTAAAPIAVVEVKGAQTDVDRDRFNGRTPVEQCWDYLKHLPHCPWGIVTNFISFRLYHRDKTPSAFELYELRDLRDSVRFREFYCLFARKFLLPSRVHADPVPLQLLRESENRQRTVGDELYKRYSEHRLALVNHLVDKLDKSLNDAIRIAQRIIDRIMFVAFCEDRRLLPERTIADTFDAVARFHRVTNPRWRNFVDLFHAMDKGHPQLEIKTGYNGGLFEFAAEVDELQLEDDWTNFFREVAEYDFREEVNVDVLGNLFERSITELERLRIGGFALAVDGDDAEAAMPKSAQRKKFGVYYTPPEFTKLIVRLSVEEVIKDRLQSVAARYGIGAGNPEFPGPAEGNIVFWRECLETLRSVKVCDPACGSGAFLVAAYDALESWYARIVEGITTHNGADAFTLSDQVADMILSDNLFGVDLSAEAVEISQLALWIRSARRGKSLADLSRNILRGNSLVSDPDVDPHALAWEEAFPGVFGRQADRRGFDCIIGNPPWERVKLQEREFFSLAAPKIAAAVNAAERRKMIEQLGEKDPELFLRYEAAQASAQRVLDYARRSGRYPLTGKGDINTYMLFAELARSMVAPRGMVGLLTPSGIATDDTTKEFFNDLMDSQALRVLYDFENKRPFFPDVHRSLKFSVLAFGGSKWRTEIVDFVFFARAMEDLEDAKRHIPLTARDMALLNPNTRTCPIFRTRRDADLTKRIYRNIPILIDETRKRGGNPWGIKFVRMFDQTNDAELFHEPEKLKKMGYRLDGNRFVKKKHVFLPFYEAKMVQAYDHRAASVVIEKENWFRQGQKEVTSIVKHQNPEFLAIPRWWINQDEVFKRIEVPRPPALLAFKNVTSPTNQRTMIASFIPLVAVGNSAPIILFDASLNTRLKCCLLANLNAYVLDYIARQKIGNVNLNFFLIEQFPMLAPDRYSDKCPWNKRTSLERWISDRVLKLTCTAEDMRPLAEAAGFEEGVHKWKPEEREQLMAELDAAYFHLYGISHDEVEYILSTFSGTDESGELLTESTSTTQRILKSYDELSRSAGTQ